MQPWNETVINSRNLNFTDLDDSAFLEPSLSGVELEGG